MLLVEIDVNVNLRQFQPIQCLKFTCDHGNDLSGNDLSGNRPRPQALK